MEKTEKIYIAGHKGLVGSAIFRTLQSAGYTNLIYRTRAELDLTNQAHVADFFSAEKPRYVFLAAAKVGGIHANNTFRGDFIFQNLAIQTNIIESAYRYGVKRLIFLGSSCIYPRDCPQPMREEYLLSGPLEPTNEPYAIAKIAGIKLCESYNMQYNTDFVAVMPTNLYGMNDKFDLETSHVLPALMRKIHEAKIRKQPHVTIWGSGSPKREFLYVDDMANACIFVMNRVGCKQMVNIGTGKEISIREVAELMCEVVGFNGDIVFDGSKPDGTPRKLVDVTRLAQLGWEAQVSLREGLRRTYQWYLTTITN